LEPIKIKCLKSNMIGVYCVGAPQSLKIILMKTFDWIVRSRPM